jgi:hypothetical protein
VRLISSTIFSRGGISANERASRTFQSIEMFVQLEDPAVVESQPFPHGITSLHCRIERADPSLIAMHQLSVDVYNQISVSLVEFLKH